MSSSRNSSNSKLDSKLDSMKFETRRNYGNIQHSCDVSGYDVTDMMFSNVSDNTVKAIVGPIGWATVVWTASFRSLYTRSRRLVVL